MAKRHSEALSIDNGACNPSGIALTIVSACQEIRDEPGFAGTAQLCNDPALKLMVNQLSFLVNGLEMIGIDHYHCVEQCKARVEKPSVTPRSDHEKLHQMDKWQRELKR